MQILKATGSKKNLTESEYYAIVEELLQTEEIQNLKQFRHHIMTTRFQHSLNVSYYHYQLCRKFGLDAESGARAGLLHDLYFYDTKAYTHSRPAVRHSKYHPEQALQNAEKILALNDKERDMIQNHMFPMTFALPRYKETFLITLVDKYCAVIEFVLPQPKRLLNRFRKKEREHVEVV